MFICLICCLLIVSVDPDIGHKTTCFFYHEIFVEKTTYHLEIKKAYHGRLWNLGEKSGILWNFLCHAKRSFEWVLESHRRVEKLVENSIIDGFVIYLANNIVVIS